MAVLLEGMTSSGFRVTSGAQKIDLRLALFSGLVAKKYVGNVVQGTAITT